jgi:hypothetical protein
MVGENSMNAQRAVIDSLLAAPEYVNPAIALALECMADETRGDQEGIERAIRSGAMERAIADGEREGTAVIKSLLSCSEAPPVASRKVPAGF